MCVAALDNSRCEAIRSRIEVIEGNLISSDNLLKANEACSGMLISTVTSVGICARNALSLTDRVAKIYCDMSCENVIILFAGFLGLSEICMALVFEHVKMHGQDFFLLECILQCRELTCMLLSEQPEHKVSFKLCGLQI